MRKGMLKCTTEFDVLVSGGENLDAFSSMTA